MSENNNTSGSVGSTVVVPVAVFTARLGYDWSKLPGFVPQDVADRTIEDIQALSQKVAGNLKPGEYIRGVIFRKDFAYVFKFHIAEKWDQAKRDADYCACAFIKKDLLGSVDIPKLFENAYFQEFSRTPAAELTTGTVTPGGNADVLCAKARAGELKEWDWNTVGTLISGRGERNEDWTFVQSSSGGAEKFYSQFGRWIDPPPPRRPSQISPDALLAGWNPSGESEEGESRPASSWILECEELKVKVEGLQAEVDRLKGENETMKKDLEVANRTVGIQKQIISKWKDGQQSHDDSDSGSKKKKGGGLVGCIIGFIVGAAIAAAAMYFFVTP